MILELLIHYLLFLSDYRIIITFAAIGFWFYDRTVFANSILITAFAVIFNYALKCYFKVPLAEFLHKEGFAFPSGHMQSSGTFYVFCLISAYLANFNKKIKVYITIATITVLAIIAYGLVFKRYHTIDEVAWALVIAILTALIYSYILFKTNQNKYIITVILTILSMICLLFAYYSCGINNYIWWFVYFFIGFAVAWVLLPTLEKPAKISLLFYANYLIILALTLWISFNDITLFRQNSALYYIHWLAVGSVFPCMAYLQDKFRKN